MAHAPKMAARAWAWVSRNGKWGDDTRKMTLAWRIMLPPGECAMASCPTSCPRHFTQDRAGTGRAEHTMALVGAECEPPFSPPSSTPSSSPRGRNREFLRARFLGERASLGNGGHGTADKEMRPPRQRGWSLPDPCRVRTPVPRLSHCALGPRTRGKSDEIRGRTGNMAMLSFAVNLPRYQRCAPLLITIPAAHPSPPLTGALAAACRERNCTTHGQGEHGRPA
jgi:hypothetical protein